jgi:hypothetical protein
MNETTITIVFTEQELNLVLNGVAQLPYVQSYQLINRIHEEYNKQRQPTPPTDAV